MARMTDFLVVLDRKRDVTYVLEFPAHLSKFAVPAYERVERMGAECCLFGSDSVDTLRQTHGNWFLTTVYVIPVRFRQYEKATA